VEPASPVSGRESADVAKDQLVYSEVATEEVFRQRCSADQDGETGERAR